MAVNKVIFGNVTLIDTSEVTVVPDALVVDKTALNARGELINGTNPYAKQETDAEVNEQADLLDQAIEALRGKVASGGGGESIDGIPADYARADYVEFNAAQLVDTGIIGNQDSQIQICFTREDSAQRYLYGCASSNNTASVTAYMGGSWRFGNKYATKALGTIDEKISYAAIVDKTQITATSSVSSIRDVNDFETIGTIIIGGCRSSDGSLSNGQFIGKLFYFVMWQGDEQVLKLIPVVSADGVYRLWDMVSKKFHDSITETPLGGGNL